MMESPELKSLKQCYPALISCVKLAPNNIADHLIPLDLLPEKVLSVLRNPKRDDDEKAEGIVNSVKFQVGQDSGVFHTFIKALTAAGPWTRRTVSKLQNKLDSYTLGSSTTSDTATTDELSQQPPHTGLITEAATGGSSDNRTTASCSHLPGIQSNGYASKLPVNLFT